MICQTNVDILRKNMMLNAECRNYKYIRDHVNHLVDVRDTIKESCSILVEASNGQGQSIHI
jgi:hypothetical protein